MIWLNFGSVPTWAAVCAASTAAVYARRAFQREQRRDDRREEAEIRAQANAISGWICNASSLKSPTWMVEAATTQTFPCTTSPSPRSLRPR